MTVYPGCCGDDSWRGRHCQYHEGYEDGMNDTERWHHVKHGPALRVKIAAAWLRFLERLLT